MTHLADRTITILRHQHDGLAALVRGLSDEDLALPSGSDEWSIAQVLSHLGSAAEIFLGTLRGADVDNQAVWARWDAATPREQADGFLEHDARLVAALEDLTAEERTSRTVELGFLPDPVPLSTFAGMRANEVIHHAWDVRVGLDQGAVLDDESAALLAEHHAGGLAFMLGFTAKPDRLDQPATVVIGDSGYAFEIDDTARITTTPAGAPTATFHGSLEAAERLLVGRLDPKHTPDDLEVSGNVSLADLRAVFPGY